MEVSAEYRSAMSTDSGVLACLSQDRLLALSTMTYPDFSAVPPRVSNHRAPHGVFVLRNPLDLQRGGVLVTLGLRTRLYLAMIESKQGRERWIRQLSLQTTDPANE
jgi:hypothetical protein